MCLVNLLIASAIVTAGTPAPCHNVSREAALLVVPILDTVLEAELGVPNNPALWKLGEQLGQLAKDSSASGDEALVVLLNYGMGAAFGEDIACYVMRRGRRLLPFLNAYLKAPPCALDRRYEPLLLKEQSRCPKLHNIIEGIKKGEEAPCN